MTGRKLEELYGALSDKKGKAFLLDKMVIIVFRPFIFLKKAYNCFW